ncbi:MAG: hypothetical protein ACOYKA_02690 [Legionellaceae bacterium]
MFSDMFSESEVERLKSFHQQGYYTPADLNTLQQMLVRAVGNMDINRAFSDLKHESSEYVIDPKTIDFIRNLSYRTRHLEKIRSQIDTIWASFESFKANKTELLEEQKFSLETYGILYDLSVLHEDLKPYQKQGLFQGSSELTELYEITRKAHSMIQTLNKQFRDEFKFSTGSVVVTDFMKKNRLYGDKQTYLERFYSFLLLFCITKFGHASKGIQAEEDDTSKISHINPEYKEDDFLLRDFLYSEVYCIKLDKLIDPATQVFLKEHLGDDWLLQLEAKYAEIESLLHDEARTRYADKKTGLTTDLAYQLATIGLQGGHKNLISYDHSNESIRDEIFLRGQWAEQGKTNEPRPLLCSEFVGKTLIAAIQALNDVIKEDLKDKGVKNIPAKLIKSPLSKREKLRYLTPERLIHALHERGAIEKIKSPQVVSKCMRELQSSAKIEMKALHKQRDASSLQVDEQAPVASIKR